MSFVSHALGDIATGIEYGVTASASETEVGPKFLRITDIQDGAVDWKSVPYCAASKKKLEKSRLAAGDIVFARTGATTGKSFLIRTCPDDAVFASYLIRVRPGPQVDPIYLSHFFDSADYWSQITLAASGAAQPGVNASKLKELNIPLPPLEEQRRIAGILDQAAELCRLRTRALDKLNTLGQAIFHEMFAASLTEAGLSSLPALRDSLITVNNGLTRRAKTGAQSDVVLRLKDVRQGEIDFTDLSRITLTDKEKAKYRVNVDDLLFIRVNGNPDYVGRNAVFKGFREDTYHNDHIMRVVLNKGALNPEFLSFVLDSPFGRKQISANMKTSAGQHTINQAGLSAIRIPMPPIKAQEKFAHRLSEITNCDAQFRLGVKEAQNLFASLQNRAFRGEL